MLRHFLLAGAIVAVFLVFGVAGYMAVSDLPLVDAFLEASMLMSGAGPIYTERSSPYALKVFSSVYALCSTLVVVTTVAVLGAPVIHRILHHLHRARGE